MKFFALLIAVATISAVAKAEDVKTVLITPSEVLSEKESTKISDSDSMDPLLDLWLSACGPVAPGHHIYVAGGYHYGLEAGSMSSLYRHNGLVTGKISPDGKCRLVLIKTKEGRPVIGGNTPSVQVITGRLAKKGEKLLLIEVKNLDDEAADLNAALKAALEK